MSLISGNATFGADAINCSSNSILGAAAFVDTASNQGTVSIASFSDTASNEGTVESAVFNDGAVNVGTLTSGTFLGTAVNSGVVTVAEFFGTASNVGVIVEAAKFADTSSNVGVVSGSAIFADTSVSNGVVEGPVQLGVDAVQGQNQTLIETPTVYTQPDGFFPNAHYYQGSKSAPADYATIVHEIGTFWYKYDASGNGELASGNYSDGTSLFTFVNGVKGAAYTPPAPSNWYEDSSSPSRTVTINGTVTQSNEGDGVRAAQFPGANNYISTDVLAIGTDDYTIEMFFNTTGFQSDPDGNILFAIGGDATYLNAISLGFSPANEIFAYNGVDLIGGQGGTVVQNNTWNHVALVRNGSSVSLYLNGALVDSSSSSSDISQTDVTIGANNAGNRWRPFAGKITGLRVVKGSALYSGSTHTVPTTVPIVVTGTQLLFNFGGTATPVNAPAPTWQNDTSSANRTLILGGGVTQSNEGGGVRAAVFDGSSGYLSVSTNTSDFDLSSGDSTIEFWFKPDSNTYGTIMRGQSGPSFNIHMYTDGNVHVNNGASGDATVPVSLNTWHHIAVVFYNGLKYVYLNGVSAGSSSQPFGASNSIHIGGSSFEGNYLDGSIAGLRVVKGTAIYTSNFTVPTTLLTDVTGTQLLLNFGATAVPSV